MEAIIAKIVEVLGQPGLIMTAAVVIEFALRFAKSEKPLSIAHLVAASLHKIAVGVEAIAAFLDKVLPQRTLPPQA